MRVNIPSLKGLFSGLEWVLTILTHNAFVGLEKPVYLCIHVFFFYYLVYGGGCWLFGWFGLVETGSPLAAQVDLGLLRVPLPQSQALELLL